MKRLNFSTPWRRTSVWARSVTLAVVAIGAWAFAATHAHARDVHFSVGVNAPGLSVGVSNAPPVYYAPPPVYYAPPPVYYSPPPVYYAPPPVYHRGVRPVVVVPPPIYYDPPRGPNRHWDNRRDHRRHDRHDRRDDRRHDGYRYR